MKCYKGFNEKLQCTPDKKVFQYEIGKEYTEESADLCKKGFHACEYPLDCFNYYDPANSRFCEVELDELSDKKDSDSKRCGKRIRIGAEIGIKGIVEASVKFILDKVDFKNAKESNTGNYSAATNTGNYSAATNTGDQSAATNTGDQSAATNTGYRSAATNTGNRSAASVEGKSSVAIVTGDKSKVKGAIGCGIVAVERGDWDGETYPIVAIKAAIVDGEKIKPDTWYVLKNGEFVEKKE